ncbi:TPA: hypothetical protein QCU53_006057, partial [Bacillus thuringiensis]|nr:hypothetical protein [Bacillus thuringiensis]
MLTHHFFDLSEGEPIYVYFTGNLKEKGRYIGMYKDGNQSFLCWKSDSGNKVYTNINLISVEILNKDNGYNQEYPDQYTPHSNDNYNQEYSDQYT